MNDKELQKIIDTKNGTISVLKDTVKKWVHEYNMLDACIELEQGKIAELKAENERLKEEMTELEEKFLTLNGKSYSYYTTLQEIKAIAEEIADTGNWLNCGYNASRAKKILDLITKAEEEWK